MSSWRCRSRSRDANGKARKLTQDDLNKMSLATSAEQCHVCCGTSSLKMSQERDATDQQGCHISNSADVLQAPDMEATVTLSSS